MSHVTFAVAAINKAYVSDFRGGLSGRKMLKEFSLKEEKNKARISFFETNLFVVKKAYFKSTAGGIF